MQQQKYDVLESDAHKELEVLLQKEGRNVYLRIMIILHQRLDKFLNLVSFHSMSLLCKSLHICNCLLMNDLSLLVSRPFFQDLCKSDSIFLFGCKFKTLDILMDTWRKAKHERIVFFEFDSEIA